MYILHLTYQAALSEVDKYLQAHREYLDYYYKQGLLVASGPATPRTGGIIITVKMARKQLDDFMRNDPFSLASIATYQVTEFTPIKHCAALAELIQQTEGKLC
ncbi:MAG: YciI family protein [Gammaproteobacteria bacterium]|nr:YciI family protein [Gammaproteobacteria bacterium]